MAARVSTATTWPTPAVQNRARWPALTGESLRDNPELTPPLDPPAQVHGLQGNNHNLVRPLNDPPTMSYFTDYDGNTADDQGHIFRSETCA